MSKVVGATSQRPSQQDLMEMLAGYCLTQYRALCFLVFCTMCGGCAAELSLESCSPSLFHAVGLDLLVF
jgi:hypothetical protein